jgi:cysteine dioxygenase
VEQQDGKYTLLVLVWSEGQGSPIHSHEKSNCFVKILGGTLRETRFEWPKEGGPPKQISREDYTNNAVTYINGKKILLPVQLCTF